MRVQTRKRVMIELKLYEGRYDNFACIYSCESSCRWRVGNEHIHMSSCEPNVGFYVSCLFEGIGKRYSPIPLFSVGSCAQYCSLKPSPFSRMCGMLDIIREVVRAVIITNVFHYNASITNQISFATIAESSNTID